MAYYKHWGICAGVYVLLVSVVKTRVQTRTRVRTRVRLEFGGLGLGLDSSIFKWTRTRLESQSQMTRTRLESFNGWTRYNTGVRRKFLRGGASSAIIRNIYFCKSQTYP